MEVITIGRIRRSWGRRGEVIVEPLTSWPERFLKLSRVYVSPSPGQRSERRVERVWFHQGELVLHLEGCSSLSDAEKIRGADIEIPQSEAVQLGEGEYYQYQLVGLRVSGPSCGDIGRVERVLETGGVDVLVVRSEKREVLIPFARDIVTRIDLAAGEIRVEPPEGLLDINEV
jgi:16S rRNA processing protein RimM